MKWNNESSLKEMEKNTNNWMWAMIRDLSSYVLVLYLLSFGNFSLSHFCMLNLGVFSDSWRKCFTVDYCFPSTIFHIRCYDKVGVCPILGQENPAWFKWSTGLVNLIWTCLWTIFWEKVVVWDTLLIYWWYWLLVWVLRE